MIAVEYVQQALASTRGWLDHGRPPEGELVLRDALDRIEERALAADLRDRYGDKLDRRCVMCGAEPGQPCVHTETVTPDMEVVREGYVSPYDKGDVRAEPHFYR